jgi:hypothetical protein
VKNLFSFVLLAALTTTSNGTGFDPFIFNYTGLGTSPVGLELKKLSGTWTSQFGSTRIKALLESSRTNYPDGTDPRKILEDAGLECAAPPAKICTYAGVYTFELRRSNGKIERSANRMDVTVDFGKEPWDVMATSQFLYGGPRNWTF